MTHIPPRLLAGITLLFWGGLTERPLIGLLAAVLVEAKSWTTTRWNLNEKSYVNAWNLAVLAGASVGILSWFNGLKANEVHTLFAWVPIFLLPIELAQRYGTRDKIELNTFLFFARKKWQRDTSIGRETDTYLINTGYPYIAITVLATATASKDGMLHFIGLSIILSVCLFSSVKKGMIRPWAWSLALITSLTLAFIGQWAAKIVLEKYTHLGADYTGQGTSTNESRTGIGKLKEIKLSSKVFWRMKATGEVPDLLTTAVYNSYSNAIWNYRPPQGVKRLDDYQGPKNVNFIEQSTVHIFDKEQPSYIKNPSFITIRGTLNAKLQENPIPLPHYTAAVLTSGKKTGLERNSLGTVRISNPDYYVIEYKAWQTGHSSTESPPNKDYDLGIPKQEKEAIHRVATALGLHDKSLSIRKKIHLIQQHFNTKFTYTTHVKTPNLSPTTQGAAVGDFLEKSRAGHCEYFATATALLLREVGIYARYSVGFSVQDQSPNGGELLIRGSSAHAWCRVWVDDHWENVDLTPPSWESIEAENQSKWLRKVIDWWQISKEDFLLWRTNNANKTSFFKIFKPLGLLIGIWVIWRLWKSRQVSSRQKNLRTQKRYPIQLTALNKLEPLIAKKIGPRPSSTPLSKWMTSILSSDPSLTEPLTRAIEIHTIIRFDPHGGSEEDEKELARITAQLTSFITK